MNPPDRPTMVVGILAAIAALTYIMVASSNELAPFAPVAVDEIARGIGAGLVGIVAVLLTEGMYESRRAAVLLLVVATPIVAYGTLLVMGWTALGGTGLIDVFVVAALQRMFGQLITTAALSAAAMMIALIVVARASRMR